MVTSGADVEAQDGEAAGKKIWQDAVYLAQPERRPPPTFHKDFAIYQKWVGKQ